MSPIRYGVVALILAGCAQGADTGSANSGTSSLLGANTVGEACTQQSSNGRSSSVYCGSWEQPSAHVIAGGAANADDLMTLAAVSPWRDSLNTRFTCASPVAGTVLSGRPAVILPCTRRVGGWPHVAMLALVDGTVWYADGVAAAVPVMERSIALLSGKATGVTAAASLSGADALLATRLAAQATKSGDIGEYEHLMAAGTRANLADSAVAAERAFRAALTLQQKALGSDNPNTADPMMLLALQLSNQGQYAEAERLFSRAGQLASRSADPAAAARLLHYQGLHELNQDHDARALALLTEAEAGYAALVPTSALQARSGSKRLLARADAGGLADLLPDQQLLVDPVVQSALLGIIETRRNRAVALRGLGRRADSEAALASAADIARANGLAVPIVTSRLFRTEGMIAGGGGQRNSALSRLSDSSEAFTHALPGSRSYALTGLLRASELVQAGNTSAALPVCREAVKLLRELLVGLEPTYLAPCLDAYSKEATSRPTQAQSLLAEMFVTAQSAQGGVTSQQIAESSARLLEGARDPKVADAIRKQQDATQELSDLLRQRDELRA